MTRFWAGLGVVTPEPTANGSSVTRADPIMQAVDRYENEAVQHALPDQYTAVGWVVKADGGGWHCAHHEHYGTTSSVFLGGNRPDLSIKRLHKQVNALMGDDQPLALKVTSLSDDLLTINEAIDTIETRIANQKNLAERLNPHRCTGTIYFRHLDSGTAVVYANHGRGVACPTCGDPEPGKRIRRYIGQEESAPHAMILDAMASEKQYQDALSEIAKLTERLRRAHSLTGALKVVTAW